MRTISLKIPESLERTLDDLASRRRMTRSAVVREAVEHLARRRTGSALDLVKDLAGSLKGPADLSSSPVHMRGYGR